MAKSPAKPRPIELSRNADLSVHLPPEALHAACDQWECDMDGSGTYQCGRTVRVPALMFDEGDAKRIRKLAAWLEDAAAWVESKPLAAKAKR